MMAQFFWTQLPPTVFVVYVLFVFSRGIDPTASAVTA